MSGAEKGQCVNQPYLGCREFAARFRLVTDPDSEAPALDESRDLGWMLYDMIAAVCTTRNRDFSGPICKTGSSTWHKRRGWHDPASTC